MQKWKNNLMDVFGILQIVMRIDPLHIFELQHIPSSSNTSHQTTMHPVKQQSIAPNQFVTINQQPLNGYCPQCIMPHNESQWTYVLHIIMKHKGALRFPSRSNNNITTNQFGASNQQPQKCALSYNKPHNGPLSQYTLH